MSTSLTSNERRDPKGPMKLELPDTAPTEVYYSQIASGRWRGKFKLQINDFGKFVKEGINLDKALTLGLHLTCRVSDLDIDSGFRCAPGTSVAKAFAKIRLPTRFPIPPVDLYEMRVQYELQQDGISALGELKEDLGPFPHLIKRQSKVSSRISDGGLKAEYQREGFGTSWKGTYTVDPNREQVQVRYQSDWGEITYDTKKVDTVKRVGVALSSAEQEAVARLSAVAHRLERLGNEWDRSLLVVFLDTYVRATRSLAAAVRSGVRVPSTVNYDVSFQRFRDPLLVAELAEGFVERFCSELTRYKAKANDQGSWRSVLDALAERPMTEIDALVLCIYTHVVVDLPHVLAEVPAILSGSSDDYELVNRVFATTVDSIQSEFASRYGSIYDWLDTLIGQYDEVLVGAQISALRAQAWYYALRLRETASHRETALFLDRKVERFMQALLAPSPEPLSVLAHVTRKAATWLRRW